MPNRNFAKVLLEITGRMPVPHLAEMLPTLKLLVIADDNL